MRVISGSLKGRVIEGYDIDGTRPTMNRVKESLFASIQGNIENRRVLDLFAGSGNLGIEAISNGAKQCYFVDYNRKCIQVIKNNLKNFNIEAFSVVWNLDYRDALKKIRDQRVVFDLILIDPPYRYQVMNEIVEFIMKNHILADDSIIVLEYQQEEVLRNDFSLTLIKHKRYGDKWISIYQKKMKIVGKAID